MTVNPSPFPFASWRGVFDAMADIERTAELYKMRAEDEGHLDTREAVWLAERVLNVLTAVKDSNVTYGFIHPAGIEAKSVSPMLTERDAIVAALDAPTSYTVRKRKA